MSGWRAPWWVGGLLVLICVAQAALLVRAEDHAAYHRSKAAEYQRLAQLLVAWPIGARMDTLLGQIGWRADDPRIQVEAGLTTVAVRPPLSVPMEQTRDYSGFLFVFRDGLLVSIEPLGPEGHAPVVDLPVGSQ